LTSIDFPVATNIGSSAFSGTALTSVYLPAARTIESGAFESCQLLAKIILPRVETLGYRALADCRKITRLELPEVKEIGSSSLSGMSALKYLSIPKVEKIGDYAFVNGTAYAIDSLRIGSVEQYCNIDHGSDKNDESAYQATFPWYELGKKNLFIGDSDAPATEITIPESVQQVPEYAFLGTGIHTIHFEGTTPPALISTKSFSGYTMLAVPEEAYDTYLAADVYNTIPLQIAREGHLTQELELEAKSTTSALLAKLGDSEIRNVVNLKITGTINSYDMMIIRNRMTSLRNLDLSEASIVDCDFVYSTSDGWNFHSVKDEITGDWLTGVMNVQLPATTKTIGYGAFQDCFNLVSVTIPDGVTSIGDRAFQNCVRIKELMLPQSVTSVGDYAFYDCAGLREVIIPDGVTSINSYAFYGCRDLEKVTIPASVKNIGYYAFTEVGNGYWDEYGNYRRTPISLRISDIDSWLDTEIGYEWGNGGAFSNVGTLFIGDSDEPVEDIVIPAGTTELKRNTFAGFSCLKSVTLPDELKTIGSGTFSRTDLAEVKMPENLNYIGSYAFSGCTNLENVEFTDSLKTIDEYAFTNCCKLKKVELPPYLQTIGVSAFANCQSLTDILIPASIQEIGDYAFLGCDNLKTVIATTVEPITINQNTFSTYRTANVYSPKTSYWKYYWNTQWNQFLSVNEYGKKFGKHYGYKYFYLRGHHGGKKEDFEIDDETGPVYGAEDEETGEEEAPDADFGEESGIIVGGEQIQELGDIHLSHNGNNGASVIAKAEGKVHIENLYVDIKTQKNRWYFFCFPFDINPGEATFDGSYVWYLYDGEARALNGNGGWKKVAADGVMQSGNGYIFQGAVNGTLTIHVKDITIDASDNSTNMITYQSDNKNDASWNLIGNSNYAYYGISDLMLEEPVTVYNNETGNYEAVRAGDDDYEFYPFQAFFVQKPDDKESVDFSNSKKNTKNMSDEKKAKKSSAPAAAPKMADSMRKIINLEFTQADVENDSVKAASDRTRIVVNPAKSTDYETDCDAAKFIAENMPQIYSLDNNGVMYSINERPMENGIVKIAVKADKKGLYTISASRLDCDAMLCDLETGSEVDLAKGDYTFAADAKTYTDRFKLVLIAGTTEISSVEAESSISVEAGAICVNDANADVRVYSVGGSLVAAQKGEGRISVPAGTYVVVNNGQSIKLTVNE
ncbi:MAG: leucine-rich repeat domain-containing protein, partial [Bacteroidales bacterium]|nr:leucine-rich repeat domain-containing protein [Candidatus Liminaster caballi]